MPSLGPSQLCLHNVVETVYSMDVMRRGIVEDIAKAVHARYVRAAQARGDTVETNPSMVPWEGLPEHLKESNRSQVADIGNKLRSINCAVVPTTDAAPFAFRDDELDRLARLEHERWMQERTQQGWRYGSVRDDQRKLHPGPRRLGRAVRRERGQGPRRRAEHPAPAAGGRLPDPSPGAVRSQDGCRPTLPWVRPPTALRPTRAWCDAGLFARGRIWYAV